jgi:hypothetical protein
MSIINPGPIGTLLDTPEQLITWVNDLGGGNALAALETVIANNPTPTFATVTLVSGTPHVNAGAAKQRYFVGITGGTAGTVGITVTDTAGTPVTHTLVPVVAANAVASQVFDVPVPAGWSITVTVSVATINASTVVTTGL